MFELNKTLESDSIFIENLALSELRLMNDCRFLWLILIPKIPNISEWHDLELFHQAQSFEETMRCAKIVKSFENIDKINIGAIGNVVSQLHIHVIGRKIGDCAWPAPPWNSGEKIAYDDYSQIIEKIKGAL